MKYVVNKRMWLILQQLVTYRTTQQCQIRRNAELELECIIFCKFICCIFNTVLCSII